MVKKLKKQIVPFIAAGVGLGVGSAVITKIGGSTAAGSTQGLQTVSSFAPVVGTALGAGAVVRSLSLLQPDKRVRIRVKKKGRF